jgi:heme/copper-type cytochrome/quinol oxidase subunit 2
MTTTITIILGLWLVSSLIVGSILDALSDQGMRKSSFKERAMLYLVLIILPFYMVKWFFDWVVVKISKNKNKQTKEQ